MKKQQKYQYITTGLLSAFCGLVVLGTTSQIVMAQSEISKTEIDDITVVSIEYVETPISKEYAETPKSQGIVLKEAEPLNPVIIEYSKPDIETNIYDPEIASSEVQQEELQQENTEYTENTEYIESIDAADYTEDVENIETVSQKNTHNYILVGDSRTVGMQDLLPDDIQVIAEVGKGYNWLSKTVDQELKNEIDDDTIVLFNLGVNDLCNINKYMNYLDELQMQFPETEIVCMTVGPVGKTTVTNEQINKYNQTMIQSDYEILDVNAILNEEGYSTVDGLHYTKETYQKISNMVTDYCDL